ncbi:hypothetical protein BC833DRAFT_582739 [Globomyces pollinis-pini]|nr:hypothetical protein BC833DRAFT_582739 [Globomyces pollinis-pini]
MQNAVEKNIEVAKVESTRPSTSQGQAVKASRINSGLSGVLDKFQSQATIERIDEGTTSTTEEEHDVAATNNELESILKVLNTRVDAYNLSVFQSKANPAGKLSLREIYLRGYSLFYAAIPDYAGAFDMFKESKSLPESKYFLGICYTYGYGTSTDFSKAKAYLLNAWNAGTFPGAMLELGRIYEFEKNMMEAFRYYLTAAALGQARACEKLAECYERGDVVYDLEEAQHWRIKADRLNFRGGP